jgi:tRNA G18 (ribose-2'-O)-methylase SpoU
MNSSSSLEHKGEQLNWKISKWPIVVIAENVHSPSNIELILRSAESFGVSTIYFSGPYSNIKSEKFRKNSHASEKYIEIIQFEDTISLIQSLKAQQYEIWALETSEHSKNITFAEFPVAKKIALIVGSEQNGINDITLKLADDVFHIKQFGRIGSLNVSIALSIALYKLTSMLDFHETE